MARFEFAATAHEDPDAMPRSAETTLPRLLSQWGKKLNAETRSHLVDAILDLVDARTAGQFHQLKPTTVAFRKAVLEWMRFNTSGERQQELRALLASK